MRLSCPGCGAVYEAPLASVGPAGRLVECGACGRRWRAFPPADVAGAEEAEASAPGAPLSAPGVPQAAAPVVPTRPTTAAAQTAAAISSPRAAVRVEPGPPPALRSARAPEDPESEPARSGGAFMAGFALVASAALIAVVVYARHDGLAAAAPALAESLTAYTDWVDARRADLRDAADSLRGRIGG